MSLLKRLNAENASVSAPVAPARPGGASGSGTSSIGTGELFARQTAPPATAPIQGTNELSSSTPKTSAQLSEAGGSGRARGGGAKNDSFELKARIQNRLIAELDPRMDLGNADEVRRTVEETFSSVLEAEAITLTRVERLRLFEAISAEILA
jgi:pilus assembly protein CpaF